MIQIKSVTKKFGKTTALNNVSLCFEENKIYGLLGRNGAGKSTLLNTISNRIFADSGEILIDGVPSVENDNALANVYIMSENNYYPEKMKIKDIFAWTKSFYPGFNMDYAMTLSKKFELDINKNVKSLSTGFSSIYKLIIALSVNVKYVFFDEPVLGLDANNRDLFYKELLEKFNMEPFTAVISTHLIEEVSSIIERTIIIKNGSIISDTDCEELLSQGYTVSGPASIADAYSAGRNVIGADSIGGLKSVYILGKTDNDIPEGLEVSKLDLQKLFIQLTNS